MDTKECVSSSCMTIYLCQKIIIIQAKDRRLFKKKATDRDWGNEMKKFCLVIYQKSYLLHDISSLILKLGKYKTYNIFKLLKLIPVRI